jgi:hypothetical protein
VTCGRVRADERSLPFRADPRVVATALDWGFDIPETTGKLIEVSSKEKENGPRYAALTEYGGVERKRTESGQS